MRVRDRDSVTILLSGGFIAASFVAVTALLPQLRASDEADAESPAATAPADAETTDPYALPQANTVDAIQKFVEKLASTPSPDKTPAGVRAHFGKMEQAADALLARNPEVAGVIEAIRLKATVLRVLEQLGDTSANKRMRDFVDKLTRDERPEVAVHGRLLDVEGRIDQLQPGDSEGAQQLIDRAVALLKEKPLTDAHIAVAFAVAEKVEREIDAKLATSANRLFAKYLKSSGNETYVNLAATFEGVARRLNVVGNPVEISGPTLDGESFDVEQWRGKVVLVDFWATWCVTCIQEMPAMKALYEKHHATGFEIVGVNLDDNVGRAGAYVATQQLPWPQLVSDKGQESEIAVRYGVYTLPTTFLIGRDGKVVAVDLFGRELEEAVGTLLESDVSK